MVNGLKILRDEVWNRWSDWSGKKYFFTVMKNVVQFLRNIGSFVFNLFFNFFQL